MENQKIQERSSAARERMDQSRREFHERLAERGVVRVGPKPTGLALLFKPVKAIFGFLVGAPARSRARQDRRLRSHLTWAKPAEAGWSKSARR